MRLRENGLCLLAQHGERIFHDFQSRSQNVAAPRGGLTVWQGMYYPVPIDEDLDSAISEFHHRRRHQYSNFLGVP